MIDQIKNANFGGMMTRFTFTALMAVAFLAPAISSAEEIWTYCESGDPGGGGPTVDIQTEVETGKYRIRVDYNRRNLESSARSSVFEIEGQANKVEEIKIDSADCMRSTFKAARGRKSLEYDTCNTFTRVTLVNFTKLNPRYEVGCQ